MRVGLHWQLNLWGLIAGIVEIVGSASISSWVPAAQFPRVPRSCFRVPAAGTLKVFWIEGDTFTDFDFVNAQAISSDLCDCYLRVGHKSIFRASNLISSTLPQEDFKAAETFPISGLLTSILRAADLRYLSNLLLI